MKHQGTFPRTICVGLTISGLAAASLMLAADEGAAEKKDVPPISAEEIKLADENQILPLPGEVLAVLKNRNPSDWESAVNEAMSLPPLPPDAGMVAVAARLGVRTADAFLAVEAESSQLLEKAMDEILVAAEKLGAGKELLDIGKEMKAKTAGGEWQEVLGLLDLAYTQAIDAVRRVGDDESVAIASASGWLRGAQIYSSALTDSYDEQASKALRQPGLVQELITRLEALPLQSRQNPAVKELSASLAKIKESVNVSTEEAVSQEQVQAVHQASKDAFAAK